MGDFSGASFALARTFAAADEVVIAAPYWDMSFPASLKLYVEQLCVNKLTFCYNEKGMPCGLTNVKKAIYFTTAGGYIGSAADLQARLAKHNAGEVPHTSKFKPWKIEAYFAFETKEKAVAFEAYLKTGSGHAFAKRHF